VLVATSHRDLGKVVTHKVRDRASWPRGSNITKRSYNLAKVF
jgi:hypothetical protein